MGTAEESEASEYAAGRVGVKAPVERRSTCAGLLTPRESAACFRGRAAVCGARFRADAPCGGCRNALCGDLRGAQSSAGVVSVRGAASGGVPRGELHGVRVLRRASSSARNVWRVSRSKRLRSRCGRRCADAARAVSACGKAGKEQRCRRIVSERVPARSLTHVPRQWHRNARAGPASPSGLTDRLRSDPVANGLVSSKLLRMLPQLHSVLNLLESGFRSGQDPGGGRHYAGPLYPWRGGADLARGSGAGAAACPAV